MSSEQKILFLVVDRTGRILDTSSCTQEYSWSVENALRGLLDSHDLSAVDIIIRNATTTAPIVTPEEIPVADVATPEPSEDIPF